LIEDYAAAIAIIRNLTTGGVLLGWQDLLLLSGHWPSHIRSTLHRSSSPEKIPIMSI